MSNSVFHLQISRPTSPSDERTSPAVGNAHTLYGSGQTQSAVHQLHGQTIDRPYKPKFHKAALYHSSSNGGAEPSREIRNLVIETSASNAHYANRSLASVASLSTATTTTASSSLSHQPMVNVNLENFTKFPQRILIHFSMSPSPSAVCSPHTNWNFSRSIYRKLYHKTRPSWKASSRHCRKNIIKLQAYHVVIVLAAAVPATPRQPHPPQPPRHLCQPRHRRHPHLYSRPRRKRINRSSASTMQRNRRLMPGYLKGQGNCQRFSNKLN